MRRRPDSSDIGRDPESGQSITEYILLLAVLVSLVLIIANFLSRFGLDKKLMKPISEDFARAYQYGHPKAKGRDDGGPFKHPRYDFGEESGRMFISPDRKR